MKEKFPIRANNVTLMDIKTGLQLKGAFIRPEIEGKLNEKGKISRYVEKSFYIISSDKTESKGRMDAIIKREIYEKILFGEEVTINSHLDERINLKMTLLKPLKDVRLSNK